MAQNPSAQAKDAPAQEKAPQGGADEEPRRVPTAWIVLAVALLAAIAFAAVWLTGREDAYVYNGFTFRQAPCPGEKTCWETDVVTNVGVHPVTFYYGPLETQQVLIDQRAVQRVLDMRTVEGGSVVIAFDEGAPGEVGLAAVQIARVTGERLYNIPTSGATYGTEGITCAASTPQRTVIYITQGRETGVRLADGCVYVTARTQEELRLVADAFTLHLLGIQRSDQS